MSKSKCGDFQYKYNSKTVKIYKKKNILNNFPNNLPLYCTEPRKN